MVKRPNLLLWSALLGPSLTWLIYLSASFSIASFACELGDGWIMPFLTAMALLISCLFLLGAKKTYTHYQYVGDQSGIFLSVLSFLLGALIILILFASELSNHLLRPCI